MRSSKCSAVALALLLAACASKPPPAPIKPLPKSGGAPATGVKIGQPYQVLGKWYYPKDEPSYDMTGIASWYGPGFHAQPTANGETYDQNGVSAAHKTLPLPSYVEVTNLDNGRKLVVRINDRGPYVDGRIIDLSRRSAQLLGVDAPGTAQVRVRRVYPDTTTTAALAPQAVTVAYVAPAPVAAPAVPQTAPPPPVRQDAPVATVAVPAGAAAAAGTRFIQVAALSDQGRAAWLAGYLKQWGPTVTERTPAGLWRVRIGPYTDDQSAAATLAQVRTAGYSDAHMVNGTPPR